MFFPRRDTPSISEPERARLKSSGGSRRRSGWRISISSMRATGQGRRQLADDGFDLGKLGHGRTSWSGPVRSRTDLQPRKWPPDHGRSLSSRANSLHPMSVRKYLPSNSTASAPTRLFRAASPRESPRPVTARTLPPEVTRPSADRLGPGVEDEESRILTHGPGQVDGLPLLIAPGIALGGQDRGYGPPGVPAEPPPGHRTAFGDGGDGLQEGTG